MADRGETSLRREIIATALAMSRSGLSHGTSGNVSARWKSGMLITPTGMAYDRLKPADIVFMDAKGRPAAGRKPSSEWRFHLSAYQARQDAAAIVHCHSRHATALACTRRSIPAFHYMVAVAGGDDIPLAGYATFGTDELARHVAKALAGRKACLMANHGQIATGLSLAKALALAEEVEQLAAQYILALTIGGVKVLPKAEMTRVLKRFATYGQQPEARSRKP
ncbi:MAG: L-fuculose-phosphate aldolase [Pseudomonadota bacterium]|nr:L-fuculose-phosphate aldolase [Pseudomonadota bacterium]